MNCKKIKDMILTDYTDGVLKKDDLEKVEAHLRSCPSCRNLAQTSRDLGNILRSVKKEEPPSRVWNNIREGLSKKPDWRILFEEAAEKIGSGILRLRPAFGFAAALATVLLVLALSRFAPVETHTNGFFTENEILAADYYDNGYATEAGYELKTPLEEYFL